MNTNTADIVRLDCSGCMEPVVVNIDQGTVTARVASNGRRGDKHVPAHNVTDDAWVDTDLTTWDCPRCGYADSTYTDPVTRRTLA